MWIWPAAQCADFKFDAQALQPAFVTARVAQGRTPGLASPLQLVDLSQLQIGAITAEAVATAQIEDEVLHPQSVRPWAARRFGLGVTVQLQAIASKPVRKNHSTHPAITASQQKLLKKLLKAGLLSEGFEGGLGNEKYVVIAGLSRDGVAATDAAD